MCAIIMTREYCNKLSWHEDKKVSFFDTHQREDCEL